MPYPRGNAVRASPSVEQIFEQPGKKKQLVKFNQVPIPSYLRGEAWPEPSQELTGYKCRRFCGRPENTQFLNCAEVFLPQYPTVMSSTDERSDHSELPSSSPTLGTSKGSLHFSLFSGCWEAPCSSLGSFHLQQFLF